MTAGLAASKRVSKGLTFAALVYTKRRGELPFRGCGGHCIACSGGGENEGGALVQGVVSMDKVQ